MNKLPLARTVGIVMQETSSDLLLYDLKINKVFCLNKTSAVVYQYCDGKTSFEELKAKTNFTDEVIFLALDQLQKESLLEGDRTSYFKGLSRREVIKKAGLTTVVALPVISGLIAPSAANAQSGCSPFENGASPGTNVSAMVDAAVQPYTDCYLLAAAKCASCSFINASGSGGNGGSTIFNCTVTCG